MVDAIGLDIPTPILTVGGAYGVRDDLEVTLHGDITAAVFGDLHVEPGVAYHPLIRESGLAPTLTVAGSVHLLTNLDDTRVAPQLTLAAAWRILRRHLIYAGADSGILFGSPSRIIVGPLLGGELRIAKMGLTIEAKWLAPYYDVAPTAPNWISPGSHGYLSIFLGATYYIGNVL